jgi:hypothetical protein
MDYTDFYSDLQQPISEDYPSTWNKEEFAKITSFNGKMKYASTHLQKLASGSGRVVFVIDEHKVLKIARNLKGCAQNQVESDRYIANYDITTLAYDTGEDVKDVGPFWIEAERASKISPSRFKQLTGVSIKDLDLYLTLLDGYFKPQIDPKLKEELDNNEFVQDLTRLMGDYDMPMGDLRRISSYGEVTRNGKPKAVLVDYGLTQGVYDDWYKVQMK